MAEYLAFQQFVPRERRGGKGCIWCGQQVIPNRAHIISKKLTLTSSQATILRYAVCQSCNSRCGQIEEWVLRNSPLGWLRFFCYLSSNKRSDTSLIPSYFYSNSLHEWLAYSLEGQRSTKTIEAQLILKKDGHLQWVSEQQHPPFDVIHNHVLKGTYEPDVRRSLPKGFSPRALVNNGRVIIVARSQNDLTSFVELLKTGRLQETTARMVLPKSSPHNRQHFKWSRANWLKLCSKISYETLCLFEGPDYCLRSEFEQVRQFVLSGVSSHSRELVFNEHGPLRFQDIPSTQGCIDLTIGQDCPQDISAMLPHAELGMHSIVIYEIDGWVCASISLSGLPPCCLVLGGPNLHLHDMYMLIYDDQEDKFDTICLAYDNRKPIIPLHLSGAMRESIVRTYKLRQVAI